MKVSVVIPAYNAEKTIGETVASSLAQTRGSLQVEVIVVDDGSTDSTAALAETAGATVIRQKNAGPAAARNQGWMKASGCFICFTDSDCVPMAGWLENLLDGFSSWQVGAMAGSYDIVNNGSWLARWVHREILERHSRMGSFVRVFGSYNVAIPKYVLDATGGFDTSYRHASGEDNDLSYRIIKSGWQIAFRPRAAVAHYHPDMLWKYLAEQYKHGYWRAKLYRDHPDMKGGDDYTLLRDRLEPFLALGIIGFSGLTLFGLSGLVIPLVAILTVYGAIQISWPIRWCFGEGRGEAIPYAAVTFLRGFARTMGLIAGILRFWFRARTMR